MRRATPGAVALLCVVILMTTAGVSGGGAFVGRVILCIIAFLCIMAMPADLADNGKDQTPKS